MANASRSSYARPLVLFVAALALAAGCSRHDDTPREDEAQAGAVTMRVAPHGAERRLGAGDIRIVTVDSGLDLALVGDTISSGLSPYALAKVRQETDTSTVSGGGFGAALEKMVKGTVASGLATRIGFPLSTVRDVRYEGGALHFDWAGAPPVKVFGTARVNGRPFLESFSPDDARRFADAVQARKRAGAGRP